MTTSQREVPMLRLRVWGTALALVISLIAGILLGIAFTDDGSTNSGLAPTLPPTDAAASSKSPPS
ncbi:MAG: hypothetical protein ACYYNF_02265 [Actinomycetes bacterium]|nr:hypothetical protein [Candidatus Nanopelagicales bacterium]MDP4887661.1 hypothetical protein [Candidatus Nanopelagicales bacterium]